MIAALAVVLTHAHVLTMSTAKPLASVVATDPRGTIAYVGDDIAAARRSVGPGAQLLDVGGRTIVPGFNDAHVHFGLAYTVGSERGIDLPELDRRAFVKAVTWASTVRPDGGWLFVSIRRLPSGIEHASDLDFVSRPLFVVTEHGGLLSHRGLARGGFSRAEAPDGLIRGRELPAALDRIVKGLPMRVLKQEAHAFLHELARFGVTSVQLIDELPDLFEMLRREGHLTARVRMVALGYRFNTRFYRPSWVAHAPDWLRVAGVKYFHDDWARMTRFELQEVIRIASQLHQQVVMHVLSRHALATFLDAIEIATRNHPSDAQFFRVDHVDEATPEQAKRLAALGITVCSNPAMLPEWHSDTAFPLRTLLDAGVALCLGTDWVGRHQPPRPLAPLASIALAVTHGGFGSRQRISAVEALAAYTAGSAHAEGLDDRKGTLTVGKFADLVVLSDDPTTVSPDRIGSIEVQLTMVGGQVVYRGGPFVAVPPRLTH